jgi:hypothetical protein
LRTHLHALEWTHIGLPQFGLPCAVFFCCTDFAEVLFGRLRRTGTTGIQEELVG